jgi:hypothetical protein
MNNQQCMAVQVCLTNSNNLSSGVTVTDPIITPSSSDASCQVVKLCKNISVTPVPPVTIAPSAPTQLQIMSLPTAPMQIITPPSQ